MIGQKRGNIDVCSWEELVGVFAFWCVGGQLLHVREMEKQEKARGLNLSKDIININ